MRVSSPRVCPNNLIHIYLATTRAVFSFTIPGRCHQYGQGTHTHTKHGSGNLSWQCKMLMIYHLLEMGISCCQDMKIAAYGISYTVSLFYPLNTDLFPWKYPSLEFYL